MGLCLSRGCRKYSDLLLSLNLLSLSTDDPSCSNSLFRDFMLLFMLFTPIPPIAPPPLPCPAFRGWMLPAPLPVLADP